MDTRVQADMLAYIARRRLLLMVPTLIGMTLMLFVMARFAPGLTGETAFGEGGMKRSTEDRKVAEQEYAAQAAYARRQRPADAVAYRQYVNWLWDACHLRFGDSVKYNMPVAGFD